MGSDSIADCDSQGSRMASSSEQMTASVKELARQHGAALVGVAPVERFDPLPPFHDAPPKGSHPRDFVPEARSVISIAQPILNPVMDAPAVGLLQRGRPRGSRPDA
jgi:epoxyqueuosine reductase QueG